MIRSTERLRLIEVRIAFTYVTFGNAVSAEKELYLVGFAEFCKFPLDGRSKRLDIGRVFGPRRDPCGVQRLEAGTLTEKFPQRFRACACCREGILGE